MVMAEVATGIILDIINAYNGFLSNIPVGTQSFLNLFLLVILIVAYSIIFWKFYRFIATKNVFGLDLNKYNKSKHRTIEKLFAGLLYFVEYIIIIPFLIFFWFALLTFFLLLLTVGIEIQTILVISAIVI